jgi:hypothetical protein
MLGSIVVDSFTIDPSARYEAIPAGTYKATFQGLEPTETANGQAIRWKFKVTEGPMAGKLISELSDPHATTGNKTGRFLVALSGKPLEGGVKVEPPQYVDRLYLVIVEPKEGGKSKVATFTALN